MMDSAGTLLAVLIAIIAIIGFAFMLRTKEEDSFDRARASGVIPLLDDDEKKRNNAKKDKAKDKGKDKKKDGDKKKEKAATAAASAHTIAEPEVTKEQVKPVAASTIPKKAEEEKKVVAAPQKEVESKKKSVSPVQATPVDADTEKEKKKAKKAKAAAVRAERETAAMIEEALEDAPFEVVTKANKKAKKAESKKTEESSVNGVSGASVHEATTGQPKNLKDLDTNKVMTRISAIDEVEPEYISYLATYFANTARQLFDGETRRAELSKAKVEHERIAALAINAKANLENEIAGNKRVISELAAKSAAASSVESTLKSKLNDATKELDKVRAETTQLRKSLAEKVAAPVQVVDNRAEIHHLEAEMKTHVSRIAELEESVRQKESALQMEKKTIEHNQLLNKSKEDEVIARDVLLQESKQNLKVLSERLTEIENKNWSLSSSNEESEKQIAELRKSVQERETMHLKETQNMKGMIDELNNEVKKFEHAKAEQTAMVAKLADKEKELNEKSSQLAQAEKQINDLRAASENYSGDAKKHTAEVEKLNKRRVTITYPPGASSVAITGTFNSWQYPIPMYFDVTDKVWITRIYVDTTALVDAFQDDEKENAGAQNDPILYDGKDVTRVHPVHIKFILDGKTWDVNQDLPIIKDEEGNDNNVIYV